MSSLAEQELVGLCRQHPCCKGHVVFSFPLDKLQTSGIPKTSP